MRASAAPARASCVAARDPGAASLARVPPVELDAACLYNAGAPLLFSYPAPPCSSPPRRDAGQSGRPGPAARWDGRRRPPPAWAGRAMLRPSLGRGGWLLRRAMARLGRPGWLAGCSVRVSSSCRAPVPLW